MPKLLWQDQWREDFDFIDPGVAQLCWLVIKRGFIQRLPSKPREEKYRDTYSAHAFSFDSFVGAGILV